MNLINTITNDARYKSVCKRVTKSSHLWKDLYQDTMVIVCSPEMKDRLIKAVDGGYLEVFIIGVINNLWHNKDRLNTSTLYLISSKFSLFESDESNLLEEYDYKELMDIELRQKTKQAVNELYKKMQSEQEEERLSAQLLWEVCKSNTHSVSKNNNTSNYQINRRITPILKDLKRKLDE